MSAETGDRGDRKRPSLAAVADEVLRAVRKLGVRDADVLASRATDFEVKVADGAIVNLTQATRKGLGLRVFVEGRLGFCTLSDFSRSSIEAAAQRAVLIAKEAEEDRHNGLAELALADETLPRDGRQADDRDVDLDLYDPHVAALDAATKIEWAHAIEAAARGADPRVRKFQDSGVSSSAFESVLVTSRGISRARRGTGISLWCTPVAEANGELQTEAWYDSKTHLNDLQSLEDVGRTAAQRAARMLGARPIKTQEVPVIFEPAMAAGLFSGLLAAVDGDMVYKKASFLADRLGEQIAAPSLTLVDDPRRPRTAGSSTFDGEGLRTTRKNIVHEGKLTTFLYDSYTARKAGVAPGGNARRGYNSLPHAGSFNFYAAAGSAERQAIYNVPRAFVVTRGLGRGVNAVSGEYSRGANGLWIEHGEVVHPVQEVTIAGDFIAMLKNIDAVGNDWQLRGTSGAPTVRIGQMTVSGR